MGDNYRTERPRSESPSIRPAAVILEWNFMASRINAIVAMMRAHKRLNIPLNLQKVSDGMTIERSQAALISGRLAIQGLRLSGETHQNQDLAFRHAVDKGYRVLRKLLELNIDMPRWGSYNLTPPPPFDGLRFFAHTDGHDWETFCGASGIDSKGTQWWAEPGPLDINDNIAVKSVDAARAWLRLRPTQAVSNKPIPVHADEVSNSWETPDPDIAHELRYLMAWIRGTQRAVKDSTNVLEKVMDELESSLRDQYQQELNMV